MAGLVNMGGGELPAGGVGDPAQAPASGREVDDVRAASKEVAEQFRTLVNAEEVGDVKQLQHLILGRLQDSNAVLSHFNDYSEHCYADVSGEFPKNARLLKSMKADLDHIFIKLRLSEFQKHEGEAENCISRCLCRWVDYRNTRPKA